MDKIRVYLNKRLNTMRCLEYIFRRSNKIDAVVTQQNDIYESSNESYITQKKRKMCCDTPNIYTG